MSTEFDPRINGDYLRKRFTEAVWGSEIAPFLFRLPEATADHVVERLVTQLLLEVGAE